MDNFQVELDLLAEKIGELSARLAVVTEREGLAMAPIEAASAAQQSALTALKAALAGVVALDQANPGAAALREIRDLSASTSEAIGALNAKLSAIDAAAKGLSESDTAIAKAAAMEVTHARAELAGSIGELKTSFEALQQAFAARDKLNPCGCYDPNRAYDRLDLVELNGSSYISTENANKEKPSRRSKKWMLSAGRGGTMAVGGAGTGVAGVGVEDGDKGEIQVSSGGTTWSVKNEAIDDAKVAAAAAIAWTKIDKTGATSSDVGLGNVDNTSDTDKPISTLQQTALDAKAAAASPTFTGTITSTGAVIAAGTAMTGEQVNVALRDNLYSATGNVTWTHSATPAVGQIYGVTVTTDSTAREITLPVTAFSAARGTDITVVTFPASSKHTVYVKRLSSGYQIMGDPLTTAQMHALLALTSSAISDFNSATRAQVEAELVAGTNITLTASSSGATRQITVASTASGSGGSGHVMNGGAAATSYSFLETIAGGAAATDFTSLPVVHGSNASVSFA